MRPWDQAKALGTIRAQMATARASIDSAMHSLEQLQAGPHAQSVLVRALEQLAMAVEAHHRTLRAAEEAAVGRLSA